MPTSVGALQSALSRFVPRGDSFVAALNQVGPRLLALGNWRDTVKEVEVSTDHPYVALPRPYGSLLAGMVDSNPIGLSSQWHDYKIVGMASSTGPSALFGLIDDGVHPVMIDLRDGDATVQGDYQFRVDPVEHGKTTLPTEGSIIINYTTAGNIPRVARFNLNGSASMVVYYASGQGATSVERISYVDVPEIVKVSVFPVSSGTTFQISEGRLDEESEFRRFRLENSTRARRVAMLMKQRWLEVKFPRDLVPFSSTNLVKQGLLAVVAEDASDLEGATYHWQICEQILEREMSDYRGSIKPKLNFDPYGIGAPSAVNLM